VKYVLVSLVILAFAVSQVLHGTVFSLFFRCLPLGVIGVAGILSVFAQRGSSNPASTRCLFWAMAFGGYVAWRIAVSPDAYLASFHSSLLLGAGCVYLLFAVTLVGTKYRLAVVSGLLVLAMAQVAVATVQFSRMPDFTPIAWVQEYIPVQYRVVSGFQSRGFFLHPNTLAALLGIVVFYALGLACWGRIPLWGRILSFYAAASCFASIVITVSRGGILATTVGLVIFAILSLYSLVVGVQFRRGIAFFGLVSIIVLAALGAYWLFRDSWQVQMRAEAFFDESARQTYWSAALRQFQIEPLFGTGARTFLYYGRMFRDIRDGSDTSYAHNEYLDLLAEYGFTGFILLVGFLASHVAEGWGSLGFALRERMANSLVARSNSAALLVASLSALAAAATHGLFDSQVQASAVAFALAMSLGILANGGVRSRRAENVLQAGVARSFRWLAVVMSCAMGVGAVVFAAKNWRPEWRLLEAQRAFFKGETAASIAFCTAGLGDKPGHPVLLSQRARGYASLAESAPDAYTRSYWLGNAEGDLSSALSLQPMDSHLAVQMARVLAACGSGSAAMMQGLRAIELDPLIAPSHEAFGWGCEAAGLKSEAIAAYRAAISLYGKDTAPSRLKILGAPN